MNYRLLFCQLCICFLLTSCGPNYLFEEKVEIPNAAWTYDNVTTFNVEITDTLQIYNLYLELEHSVDYPKQNIYILIHTQFPTGEKITERVPIDFADKGGQWYGDCGKEWCKLSVNIQEGAFFNALGQHTFGVEQYMRLDPLPGIKSVAFKIEQTENKRQQ